MMLHQEKQMKEIEMTYLKAVLHLLIVKAR